MQALPAFGHALDQLPAPGDGVFDGRLGAQQQLVAVGVEAGDFVQAEQVPADAGGQCAGHAGGHAAPIGQAPGFFGQRTEHQHRGTEQGDEQIGDEPGFRSEGEARKTMVGGQQGEL
ncbi:hypothetical protein D9M68_227870 [compost metagenome]